MHQGNKWQKAGTGGASAAFKEKLYQTIAKAKVSYPFYIPELSFHYFYLNRDTVPDLVAYDCTDGTGPASQFIIPAGDSITIIDSIKGYTAEVRTRDTDFTIVTHPSYPEAPVFCRNIYIYKIFNSAFVPSSFITFISARGMKLPANYQQEKTFVLLRDVVFENTNENSSGKDVSFAKGSNGILLAEEENQYFVAMHANGKEKNYFTEYVSDRLKQNPEVIYILGWIKKDN